jgi:Rrf2 family cysteine metabolism transcriptional repressor
MISLARHYGQGPVFLREIAHEEDISEKYLSLIILSLKGAGLVNSTRGANGGYALARPPSQITLRQIIEVFEGRCLVDCLKNPSSCPRVHLCASRDVWALLEGKISEILESVSLEQMVQVHRRKTEENVMNNI